MTLWHRYESFVLRMVNYNPTLTAILTAIPMAKGAFYLFGLIT